MKGPPIHTKSDTISIAWKVPHSRLRVQVPGSRGMAALGEMMKANILVVDDEESIRFTFERFLNAEGHTVATAAGYKDALNKVDETDFDLIFADIMLEDGSGMDLLGDVRRKRPHRPVIIITAHPSVETVQDCLRLGAFDYMIKPVRQIDILNSLNKALEQMENADGGEWASGTLEP